MTLNFAIQNKAWQIERMEAPIMLPISLVNPNYTQDDIWTFVAHDANDPILVARPLLQPRADSSHYFFIAGTNVRHSSIGNGITSYHLSIPVKMVRRCMSMTPSVATREKNFERCS